MNKLYITYQEYYNDMLELLSKLNSSDYDCIVASKRSGWILGVFYSNTLKLPVFTSSEIKNIPEKFMRVLLLDDKIATGKTGNFLKNKLHNKKVTFCTMYVKNDIYPDIYLKKIDDNYYLRLWYEN